MSEELINLISSTSCGAAAMVPGSLSVYRSLHIRWLFRFMEIDGSMIGENRAAFIDFAARVLTPPPPPPPPVTQVTKSDKVDISDYCAFLNTWSSEPTIANITKHKGLLPTASRDVTVGYLTGVVKCLSNGNSDSHQVFAVLASKLLEPADCILVQQVMSNIVVYHKAKNSIKSTPVSEPAVSQTRLQTQKPSTCPYLSSCPCSLSQTAKCSSLYSSVPSAVPSITSFKPVPTCSSLCSLPAAATVPSVSKSRQSVPMSLATAATAAAMSSSLSKLQVPGMNSLIESAIGPIVGGLIEQAIPFISSLLPSGVSISVSADMSDTDYDTDSEQCDVKTKKPIVRKPNTKVATSSATTSSCSSKDTGSRGTNHGKGRPVAGFGSPSAVATATATTCNKSGLKYLLEGLNEEIVGTGIKVCTIGDDVGCQSDECVAITSRFNDKLTDIKVVIYDINLYRQCPPIKYINDLNCSSDPILSMLLMAFPKLASLLSYATELSQSLSSPDDIVTNNSDCILMMDIEQACGLLAKWLTVSAVRISATCSNEELTCACDLINKLVAIVSNNHGDSNQHLKPECMIELCKAFNKYAGDIKDTTCSHDGNADSTCNEMWADVVRINNKIIDMIQSGHNTDQTTPTPNITTLLQSMLFSTQQQQPSATVSGESQAQAQSHEKSAPIPVIRPKGHMSSSFPSSIPSAKGEELVDMIKAMAETSCSTPEPVKRRPMMFSSFINPDIGTNTTSATGGNLAKPMISLLDKMFSEFGNDGTSTTSQSTADAQSMINSLLGMASSMASTMTTPATQQQNHNVDDHKSNAFTSPSCSTNVPETSTNIDVVLPQSVCSDVTSSPSTEVTVDSTRCISNSSDDSSDDSDTSLVQSQEFIDDIVAEQLAEQALADLASSITTTVTNNTGTNSGQRKLADVLGFLGNRQ